MVAFTQHDLQFILDGIVVSEDHAEQTNSDLGGVWTVADIENSRQILRGLLPNSLEPMRGRVRADRRGAGAPPAPNTAINPARRGGCRASRPRARSPRSPTLCGS